MDDGNCQPRTIWIDLDNSPHVPFFAPIIHELNKRGYSTCLTARDAFQVNGLTELFHLPCKRIGRHYGKSRALKILGTGLRSLQLLRTAWQAKPGLAVSHGSRSQMLAAALLRIPSLAITDYEFAKFSAVPATWLMVPEVIPDSAIPASPDRILRYPGIKEDVYAPGFRPDASIMAELGVRENDLMVTVRPPATEAHYHNPESETLYNAVMDRLSRAPDVKVILLPRSAKQAAAARLSWPELFSAGKFVIPERVVNGLNLVWHSDLVISGGGTMNREAAALAVPVYSIFRGRIGCVDQYLAERGRLMLIETVEEVFTNILLQRRTRPDVCATIDHGTLSIVVDAIIALLGKQSVPIGGAALERSVPCRQAHAGQQR